MTYSVNLDMPRCPEDLERAAALQAFGVATVAESQAKTGLLTPDIIPRQQGVAIAGTAVTVRMAAGDNLMLHAALEACQPGDVLVVTTMAPAAHGVFGELLATACQVRGVVGAVLDTGVRDTAALRAMGFPVWSRYVTAAGTIKTAPGWVNQPVVLAGAAVSAGDYVVADDDGVVVVPRASVGTVLQACQTRVEKEAATRSKIQAGRLSVDFYGLRPLLEQLGVQYLRPSDSRNGKE